MSWADFQKRNGLVPDGIPGAKTLEVVLDIESRCDTKVYRRPSSSPRPWYDLARAEIGVKEVVGANHNPRVLEYLETCSRDNGGNIGDHAASMDETPWCAAFVGWCLQGAGVESTRSAWARSYANWGKECLPVRGAVAVLARGQGGHVGFVSHVEGAQVYLLGGNQRNAVNVWPYPRSRVISYRWPTGWPLPA